MRTLVLCRYHGDETPHGGTTGRKRYQELKQSKTLECRREQFTNTATDSTKRKQGCGGGEEDEGGEEERACGLPGLLADSALHRVTPSSDGSVGKQAASEMWPCGYALACG